MRRWLPVTVSAALGASAGFVWFEVTKTCSVTVGGSLSSTRCEVSIFDWRFASEVGLVLALALGAVVGAVVGTLLFTPRRHPA